jgi:hypothetical protein
VSTPEEAKNHQSDCCHDGKLNAKREKPDDDVHNGGEKDKNDHYPNTSNGNPGG